MAWDNNPANYVASSKQTIEALYLAKQIKDKGVKGYYKAVGPLGFALAISKMSEAVSSSYWDRIKKLFHLKFNFAEGDSILSRVGKIFSNPGALAIAGLGGAGLFYALNSTPAAVVSPTTPKPPVIDPSTGNSNSSSSSSAAGNSSSSAGNTTCLHYIIKVVGGQTTLVCDQWGPAKVVAKAATAPTTQSLRVEAPIVTGASTPRQYSLISQNAADTSLSRVTALAKNPESTMVVGTFDTAQTHGAHAEMQ